MRWGCPAAPRHWPRGRRRLWVPGRPYARRIMEGTLASLDRQRATSPTASVSRTLWWPQLWPSLLRRQPRSCHADFEPGRRRGRPSPPMLDRARWFDPARNREDSGREARICRVSPERGVGRDKWLAVGEGVPLNAFGLTRIIVVWLRPKHPFQVCRLLELFV